MLIGQSEVVMDTHAGLTLTPRDWCLPQLLLPIMRLSLLPSEGATLTSNFQCHQGKHSSLCVSKGENEVSTFYQDLNAKINLQCIEEIGKEQ